MRTAGFGGYFFSSQAGIKSVQRGTITLTGASTSNTATITAVVVANTILKYGGFTNTSTNTFNLPADPNAMHMGITLTNTTTVTATRATGLNYGTITVPYETAEYQAGALRQSAYGTIAISAAATATATVSVTDTTKAHLEGLGFYEDGNATRQVGQIYPNHLLTNSTTITASVGISPASVFTVTVPYNLVEWP
jgi:hypothetical protein